MKVDEFKSHLQQYETLKAKLERPLAPATAALVDHVQYVLYDMLEDLEREEDRKEYRAHVARLQGRMQQNVTVSNIADMRTTRTCVIS